MEKKETPKAPAFTPAEDAVLLSLYNDAMAESSKQAKKNLLSGAWDSIVELYNIQKPSGTCVRTKDQLQSRRSKLVTPDASDKEQEFQNLAHELAKICLEMDLLETKKFSIISALKKNADQKD